MKIMEYAAMDAVALATLLKRREITSVELIERAFERLEQVNPSINAATYTRKEKALKEAKKKQKSAFHGIPIVLKDASQTIAREPNTNGARLLTNHIATFTSNFVKKLYKAGFISIGSSTTPEFCIKNTTESKQYGPTRNPWNLAHSPGGSSGGSAALVAAGVVPVAGASDGGGSIRIPASFTGLVGLKPTRGRTPVGPGSGRSWHGAAIDFVLAKTVRDVARCLDELQVFQPEAAFHIPLYAHSYEATIQHVLKVPFRVAFSIESPVGTQVSQAAKEAVIKTVKWLEQVGFIPEEVPYPVDGIQLMREYYRMNCGEIAALLQRLEKQLGRKITKDDVEIETWLLYQVGKSISAIDFTNSIAFWDYVTEKMVRFHERYYFFLTPTTAFPAPVIGQFTPCKEEEEFFSEQIKRREGEAQLDFIYDLFLPSLTYTPFTVLANLTGQPAISIPVHKTKEGLPLGVQIMAPKGEEHRLLQLAAMLEQSSIWAGLKNTVLPIS